MLSFSIFVLTCVWVPLFSMFVLMCVSLPSFYMFMLTGVSVPSFSMVVMTGVSLSWWCVCVDRCITVLIVCLCWQVYHCPDCVFVLTGVSLSWSCVCVDRCITVLIMCLCWQVYRRSHDASQSPDALLVSINLQEEVINAVSLEVSSLNGSALSLSEWVCSVLMTTPLGHTKLHVPPSPLQLAGYLGGGLASTLVFNSRLMLHRISVFA